VAGREKNKPSPLNVKVDPTAIPKPHKLRDRVFQMRLTAAERREIKETAKALGLTATAYLLGLHAQAVEALREKGGGSDG